MKEIFVHPCEVWFGGGHVRLRTILGSCVAITLWHPTLRVGGMCHYMTSCRHVQRANQTNGCHAEKAMEMLQAKIRATGRSPDEFEAKVFGGGHMFPDKGGPICHLGWVQVANITAGKELLARHGHRVVAEHLGGEGHRQLIFEVPTGQVWLKHNPPRKTAGHDGRKAA